MTRGERRDKYCTVRLSPAELERIRVAADFDGLTQTKWARQVLMRAAAKRLDANPPEKEGR